MIPTKGYKKKLEFICLKNVAKSDSRKSRTYNLVENVIIQIPFALQTLFNSFLLL